MFHGASHSLTAFLFHSLPPVAVWSEQKLIAEGAIVPVAVTLGLLKEAMQENMKQGKFNFLVDGSARVDHERPSLRGLRHEQRASGGESS